MAHTRNIALMLEDAPAAAHCVATGLSKALVPMLQELAPYVVFASIVQTHRWLPPEDILDFGARRSEIAGKWHRLIALMSVKLPWQWAVRAASLHGYWIGRQMRKQLRNEHRTDALWGAIGVDPLSLVRLSACAQAAGLPFEAYLVDDIETHPANATLPDLKSLLRNLLLQAHRIYTITPEMGSRFAVRYGVKATHLPLSAVCPDDSSVFDTPAHFFACYLGSVNHLYEAGLRLLVQITTELRAVRGQDLRLRVISRREDMARTLGGADSIPPWVVCGPAAAHESLGALLADSQCCFLPYSFEQSAKIMIGSSFPSKLLDYLGWARQILVFAPIDSVPYKIFVRESLDLVTADSAELSQFLTVISGSVVNNSTKYRTALRRGHGAGLASDIVLNGGAAPAAAVN